MSKLLVKSRWLAGALVACVFASGGCISNAQFRDFMQTEVARVTADVAGRLFLMFVQSIIPVSGT